MNEQIPNQCQYIDKSLSYSCSEEVTVKYPDTDNSKHHCIFHSKNDNKSTDFYRMLWQKIRQNNQVVTTDLISYKKLSSEEIRKKHCLNFIGFHFPQLEYFNNSLALEVIESDIKFNFSEFNKFFVLDSLTFKGKTDFSNTTFDADVNFHKVVFENICVFREAHFIKANVTIMFDQAEFSDDVDFSLARFYSVASFKDAEFKGEAIFIGVMFKNDANFNGAIFHKGLNLNQSVFYGDAIFLGSGYYNYSSNGIISGPLRLSRSLFFKECNFEERSFSGPVYIDNTIFREDIRFTNSSFNSSLILVKSLFIKALKINNCRLDEKCSFYCNSFFCGILDLSHSSFLLKDFHFDNPVFNGQILLNNVSLNQARFFNCYLGTTSFLESDVRESNFINCFWRQDNLNEQVGEHKSYFKDLLSKKMEYVAIHNDRYLCLLRKIVDEIKTCSRQINKRDFCRDIILFDELRYREDKNKSHSDQAIKLETLYRQFKSNMDRNKSFVQANDFYFGEKFFEIKGLWHNLLTNHIPREHGFIFLRKIVKNFLLKIPLFFKWLFLAIYYILNGFGNRPFRTFLWFASIMLFNSWLLINCNALKIAEKDVKKIILSESVISDQKTLSSKLEAVSTNNRKVNSSLSNRLHFYIITMWNLKAPIGAKIDFEPVNWVWHLYIFFIQYVFRPFMIAMLIISVRRKVHRGE